MSNIKKASYTWTLHGFRKLVSQYNLDEYIVSPVFPAVETHCQWQIECYPSGRKDRRFDIALYLLRVFNMKDIKEVAAKVSLEIKDSNDEVIWKKCSEDSFSNDTPSWGYQSTISRLSLLNKITDDVVKIRAIVWIEKITFVSTCDVLKWDTEANAVDRLSSDFNAIFENKKFTDFILNVAGEDIPIHRTVLAARSAVFSAMFDHDTLETTRGYAEIEGISKATLTLLLKFMYTGKFEKLTIEDTESLLAAADKYDVMDLKFLCEDTLSENLKIANALHTLMFADKHNAKTLKENAKEYITKNIWKFTSEDIFKSVEKQAPSLLSELLSQMSELQDKNRKNEFGKKFDEKLNSC